MPQHGEGHLPCQGADPSPALSPRDLSPPTTFLYRDPSCLCPTVPCSHTNPAQYQTPPETVHLHSAPLSVPEGFCPLPLVPHEPSGRGAGTAPVTPPQPWGETPELEREHQGLAGSGGRGMGHGPPEVTVFPEDPVELGEPNVLICFVDKFSPPVLRMTWLKNGQEVTEGVSETDFYPHQDNSFRKFSYLPFLPSQGDFYNCRVEHWGLLEPFTKHWEIQVPTPVPETTETLVCALGLAVGIIGIIAGTILIIKGMKMNATRNPRGPL
uniref:Ig-like domain-containing protein n=1 Tax=Chrysemys picta bellii TaxID=8478 RepID=A0A8C3P8Q9_CHRPI